MKLGKIREHILKLDWDNRPAVAQGLAIGFFFGMLPIFGAQIFIALAIAHFMKASRAAALLMLLISNPLTLVPLYAACYWVGVVIAGFFGYPINLQWPADLATAVNEGGQLYVIVFLGSFSIGLIGALALYGAAMFAPPIGMWQKPIPPHEEE